MSQPYDNTPPRRSGCAVFVGVLLILIGSVALSYNVLGGFGMPALRVLVQGLTQFATYWPLIFIGWGAFKVITRIVRPERSTVTVFEMLMLGLVLIAGLSVSGAKRAMEEMSVHVTLDDVAGLIGPELLGPQRRFESSQSFDAAGIDAVSISNPRGRVAVSGWDEPRLVVSLVKRLYGSSASDAERIADGVRLELDESVSPARLSVAVEGEHRIGTDLSVKLPKGVRVTIDNGRGPVQVEGLGAPVRVSTAHGSIVGTDLSAGVDAQTTSADIELRRIVGAVGARTRDGGLTAVEIDGDVELRGSKGPVRLERVSGRATVETRQSSVAAEDIGGALDIRARYGGVSVERARGDVTIATSNRPVFVNGVSGTLRLTTRNSNVVVREISEDLSVENRYRPVLIANVSGTTTVDAEQSAVDIEDARGPITVNSSHEDVRVAGFRSSLDIRATHAELVVVADQIEGAVTLETSYGDVRLELPESAAARIEGATTDGDVHSAFPATRVEPSGDGESRFETTLGAGTHRVTVSTRYGDVRLVEKR